MNYPRSAMLDAVNTVKPALAAKDLIEALTHVWFDGTNMTTYNDSISIQVPFKTDFKGGIRGSLLLGLLSNSRAKEVELEPTDDGHMKLVASRTRAKLALLGEDDAMWEFPAFSTKATFEIGEDFIRALTAVMVSVGNDTAIPEKLGVTVVADKGVRLYTTDSKVITTAGAKTPKGAWLKAGKRAILPTAFCEQVLRLCAGGGFMLIAPDHAVAGNGDGALVWAKLVDAPQPLDFAATVARHGNTAKQAAFEVPSKLAMALDRAIVLLEGVIGESVSMSTAAGKLRLEAHAEGRGNVKDYISLPDGLPEVELRIDPTLVKRALPAATHISITEDSVVLTGPDEFFCLVSPSGA